jgi:hypothetical protein
MKRIHAVPLVLILGAAAGGGLIAVTQTASADTPAAATVAPVDIEQREAQVSQIEADLQAQLDQRPPPLPDVPSFEPVPEPKAKNAKKAAPAQKVIVRMAAPAPAAAYEEYEEAEEYEEEEASYEQEGDSEHDEREYEGGEDDD